MSSPSLFSRILFWLFLEILLSMLGMDNLADYSEFLQGLQSHPQNEPKALLTT